MYGSFLAGEPREAEKAPKRSICGVALVPRRSTYTKYASLLGMSGALHLGLFDQPPRSHQIQYACLTDARSIHILSLKY